MRTMGMVWALLVAVGCGAATEAEQVPAPSVTQTLPEIMGCLGEVDASQAAECAFTAEAGQAYWAEASGDVAATTRGMLCDDAGCVEATVAVTPGFGARMSVLACTRATKVIARFFAP